jgi:hypothetical protein
MSDSDLIFRIPPPPNWTPEVGDPVRVLYQNRTFEGHITQILMNPETFVVESDDLLMPVACSRSSIRPLP